MNVKQRSWYHPGTTATPKLSRSRPRPCRLLFLGPPGAGKGTQAKLLGNRLGTCHLSTGDLFRKAKREGAKSPAMKQALDAMQQGRLVSDEMVVAMVRECTDCLQSDQGFVLDGFPRTVSQAESFAELMVELDLALDAAIYYESPIEEIVERLSGRRTCTACQSVFHVTAHPPLVGEICDYCGGALIQRRDDAAETIVVRMQSYEEATLPLIDYYERQGLLQAIQGSGSPREVFQTTLSRLSQIGLCEPARAV